MFYARSGGVAAVPPYAADPSNKHAWEIEQNRHRKHLLAVSKSLPAIDQKEPETFVDASLQRGRERSRAYVDRVRHQHVGQENRKLMGALHEIAAKPSISMKRIKSEPWVLPPLTMEHNKARVRSRQQQAIAAENDRLLKRLKSVGTTFNRKRDESEYVRHSRAVLDMAKVPPPGGRPRARRQVVQLPPLPETATGRSMPSSFARRQPPKIGSPKLEIADTAYDVEEGDFVPAAELLSPTEEGSKRDLAAVGRSMQPRVAAGEERRRKKAAKRLVDRLEPCPETSPADEADIHGDGEPSAADIETEQLWAATVLANAEDSSSPGHDAAAVASHYPGRDEDVVASQDLSNFERSEDVAPCQDPGEHSAERSSLADAGAAATSRAAQGAADSCSSASPPRKMDGAVEDILTDLPEATGAKASVPTSPVSRGCEAPADPAAEPANSASAAVFIDVPEAMDTESALELSGATSPTCGAPPNLVPVSSDAPEVWDATSAPEGADGDSSSSASAFFAAKAMLTDKSWFGGSVRTVRTEASDGDLDSEFFAMAEQFAAGIAGVNCSDSWLDVNLGDAEPTDAWGQ